MEDRQIALSELRVHTKLPQDVWIVVDCIVWDITEFAPSHPGGASSKILGFKLRS
jgi:L-lactate dehydrogenase (cytochrome)